MRIGGVAKLITPRLIPIRDLQGVYQTVRIGALPKTWIPNAIFMRPRVMEKKGIEQDIQIAMACDYAFQDVVQESFPPGTKARATLLPLSPE